VWAWCCYPTSSLRPRRCRLESAGIVLSLAGSGVIAIGTGVGRRFLQGGDRWRSPRSLVGASSAGPRDVGQRGFEPILNARLACNLLLCISASVYGGEPRTVVLRAEAHDSSRRVGVSVSYPRRAWRSPALFLMSRSPPRLAWHAVHPDRLVATQVASTRGRASRPYADGQPRVRALARRSLSSRSVRSRLERRTERATLYGPLSMPGAGASRSSAGGFEVAIMRFFHEVSRCQRTCSGNLRPRRRSHLVRTRRRCGSHHDWPVRILNPSLPMH